MFLLYRLDQDGQMYQRMEKEVRLARALIEHFSNQAQLKNPDPMSDMPWEMSGDELVRVVLKQCLVDPQTEDATRFKVVIDATYTRSDAMLFDICDVWGFSRPDWTTILLRLRELCDQHRPRGRKTPLDQFRDDNSTRASDFVHEFLYLQCGHQGGKRNWGRTGYTNAALLYPPALEHLLGRIGFRRATTASQP